MSQVRPSDARVRGALSRLLGPIAGELVEVERRLEQELRHRDPYIDELARHSFRMGGKRLRPALLLLAAKIAGDVNENHRTLAAVVEMVHTATLVHDDVLDDAVVRRPADSGQRRAGHDEQHRRRREPFDAASVSGSDDGGDRRQAERQKERAE